MTETVRVDSLTAGDVIGIFKPRIALSIMLSAIGGAAISAGPQPDLWQWIVLAGGVFFAAASAGAFNQWAEWDLDARMARTAGRPFASGLLHPGPGWLAIILSLLFVSVAAVSVAVNVWAAFYTFMGAFTYGVVYTLWLKRRTWLNIIVGGAAGSFAVLAGAAAVDPLIAPEALILAIVLFLWTPPHFWSLAIAANDDYGKNGVPMLPSVVGFKTSAWVILGHTVALSLCAVVPAAYGMGPIYLLCSVAGGALFTTASVRLVLEPTRRRALQNFLSSLVQLMLLMTGIMLDRWMSGGIG